MLCTVICVASRVHICLVVSSTPLARIWYSHCAVYSMFRNQLVLFTPLQRSNSLHCSLSCAAHSELSVLLLMPCHAQHLLFAPDCNLYYYLNKSVLVCQRWMSRAKQSLWTTLYMCIYIYIYIFVTPFCTARNIPVTDQEPTGVWSETVLFGMEVFKILATQKLFVQRWKPWV